MSTHGKNNGSVELMSIKAFFLKMLISLDADPLGFIYEYMSIGE